MKTMTMHLALAPSYRLFFRKDLQETAYIGVHPSEYQDTELEMQT